MTTLVAAMFLAGSGPVVPTISKTIVYQRNVARGIMSAFSKTLRQEMDASVRASVARAKETSALADAVLKHAAAKKAAERAERERQGRIYD